MTNMAAMLIYGKKTLKTSSLEPKGRLKVGMQYRVFEYYKVCSNDAPVLTFNYFMARSNLVPCAVVWGKGQTMNFSELSI